MIFYIFSTLLVLCDATANIFCQCCFCVGIKSRGSRGWSPLLIYVDHPKRYSHLLSFFSSVFARVVSLPAISPFLSVSSEFVFAGGARVHTMFLSFSRTRQLKLTPGVSDTHLKIVAWSCHLHP